MPLSPNPYMRQIQEAALKDLPLFANQELLVKNCSYPGSYIEVIEDVKISEIAGICRSDNLGNNYVTGMTFMDVLLKCLSGPNLIEKSLDYFTNNQVKAHCREKRVQYQEFPQDTLKFTGKDLAQGGIRLIKYEDGYFAENGKQRTIMAMFWIYHNEGIEGTFKQVAVMRPHV